MTTQTIAPAGIVFRAEDITFDAENHEYWANGLIRVPSVSEVLRPLTDKWLRQIPEEMLNWKRDLGTAVHRACELLERDELDESTLDPRIVPYLEGYKRFLVDYRPLWTDAESIVVDRQGRYAGTLDRAGRIEGAPAVLDIKTSRTMQPTTALQVWAYAMAYQGDRDDPDLYGLQLLPDGSYSLHSYTQYDLYKVVWDGLLALKHWEKETNR